MVHSEYFEEAQGLASEGFSAQPWIEALLTRRQLLNMNRVSCVGRTHEVTQWQRNQWFCDRLFAFDLFVIPEEEYIIKFFPEGKRIDPYDPFTRDPVNDPDRLKDHPTMSM